MSIRLGGVRVRVRGALFVMIGLMLLLAPNDAASLGYALCALAAHEAAHILMAKREHVPVHELELTPIGGALRIQRLDTLRKGQAVRIALAGPAINALIACAVCLLATAQWLPARHMGMAFRANALLCVFNLLPALPLDGGRIVLALLAEHVRRERAGKAMLFLGYLLAGCFLAFALECAIMRMPIPIVPVMIALFLIVAANRERMFLFAPQVWSLLERETEFAQEGAMPVKWLAATVDMPAREVISRMKPRAVHRIAVYDNAMRLAGVLEEEMILRAALHDSDKTVGQLLTP